MEKTKRPPPPPPSMPKPNPDPEQGIRVTGRSRKLRKSLKRGRRTRRRMKGGYYGAVGAIAPGAMEWGAGSEYGAFVADRGSNSSVYGPPKPMQYGRGRTKRSKKKGLKMKGGGSFGAVSAGYVGPQGYRGTGPVDVVQQNTKGPVGSGVAKHGAFNDNGPKGGWSAYKGLFPK